MVSSVRVVILIVSLVYGIKGQCLQWLLVDNVINKVPVNGNYVTSPGKADCATKCSEHAGCVSFFFIHSTQNNCLLYDDVITEDGVSNLVDVTNSWYYVLNDRKANTVTPPSLCVVINEFQTVQLTDGTTLTYKIFQDKLKHDDAIQRCAEYNSHMIRVTTLQKLQFMNDLVQGPGCEVDFYVDGSNANADDKTTLDGWLLSNGAHVPVTSEFWNGETSTHPSRNCLLFSKLTMSLNDTPCSKKCSFICEKTF